MSMISYAQNAEDVLLRRLFPEPSGVYVDVGANHPVYHSVTKHFYDQGWRGINIEPLPHIFRELAHQRPRDINLNIGVSDQVGTLTIHEPKTSAGMATFSHEFAEALRTEGHEFVTHDVPVSTLARIFEEYGPEPIDFLKIDAEDHESYVIRGADWNRWRPRALVVEGDPAKWEHMLIEADYLYAACDGINRYYLRREDRDLIPRLNTPANFIDDYIPYDFHRPLLEARAALASAENELQILRCRLDDGHSMGPTTLAVARRLRALAHRYPGMAAHAKRMLRRIA